MILARIADAERYYALHRAFKTFFDYISAHDLPHAPAGRITVDGDRLFINVDDAVKQPATDRRLEVHRRYIDIQVPLSAPERVGWSPLSGIAVPMDDTFDENRDIGFFSMPAETYVDVRPGWFYIMFPDDAHAPLVGDGPIRKLIGKVRID